MAETACQERVAELTLLKDLLCVATVALFLGACATYLRLLDRMVSHR